MEGTGFCPYWNRQFILETDQPFLHAVLLSKLSPTDLQNALSTDMSFQTVLFPIKELNSQINELWQWDYAL